MELTKWQLACLMVAAINIAAAAAADPEAEVQAAHFKHGGGSCPRGCRMQHMDTTSYCRMCSACSGYKKRCDVAACSSLPPPIANGDWPSTCQSVPSGTQCTAICGPGYTGTVTSTCMASSRKKLNGGYASTATYKNRKPKSPWSTPSGTCVKSGTCTTVAQCPVPENGKPLCLSGLCDVACNDNFIKYPDEAGTGFVCKAVEAIGSLSMPGKFSVWVGGFSSLAGWNGAQWDFRYPDATVTGLALASDTYAVAVGGPNYYIFNNGEWKAYVSPAYLYGATTGPDQFWMVGAQGTVWSVTADFTQYSDQVPGVTSTLIGVVATGQETAVAVGEGGTIVNLKGKDPSGWRKAQSGTTANLNAIAAGAGALWTVGDMGTILQNKGSGWVSQKSGTAKELYDITVVSSNLAWAVGAGGTILKYDGSSWAAVAPVTTLSLYAVHAWTPTAAMAFGQNSVVLSWDGTKWTVASNPGIGAFYTVGVLPDASRRRAGLKLLQSDIPDPPGQEGFTPSISTCVSGDPVSVLVTDPSLISPTDPDAPVNLPQCPSDGGNLLRCKTAQGSVVCDQNVNFEGCQWQASGGSVTSGSGKCPNSGSYCGVISGDRPRLSALAGISGNPLGTGYRLDKSQGQYLLNDESKFPPCARADQTEWPEAEPDDVKEKRILLESKSILVGDTSKPNSTTLDTWKVSTQPCGSGFVQPWEGISCSVGIVVGIELPGGFDGKRLHGKLPDSWGQLSRLVKIQMQGNNFEGSIPSSWSQLKRLETVDLSSNKQLTGRLPASWSNMTVLSVIKLSGCNLYGALPDSWGQLPCFVDTSCRPSDDAKSFNISNVELDLSANKFTGSIPQSWGNMANLAKIDLGYNSLAGTLPSFFGRLPFLTSLSLSKNKFTGNLPAEWADMGSAIRGRPTTVVGMLPYLTLIIKFSQNQISGSVPSSWSRMNPPLILALSLYDNPQLSGCLPYAWYTRFPVPHVTQMWANEAATQGQPQTVSCTGFTECNPFLPPFLKPDFEVLVKTKITGWCPA